MSPKARSNGRKKQKRYYSGKKKRHTIKTQVRACLKSRRIIDTRFAKGARHDFSLYKHSRTMLPEDVECLADSGYQGMAAIYPNSRTPVKKPKGGQLTDEQKQSNRKLAQERVVIESILAV